MTLVSFDFLNIFLQDQDSDNIECEIAKSHQLKMPTLDQIPQDAGSPDDWIEIGSPLSDDPTQPVKVDFLLKNGSSDSSPSSGGSVDECFDFGSFSKASDGVESDYEKDRMVPKKVVLNGKFGEYFAPVCTDIDELD